MLANFQMNAYHLTAIMAAGMLLAIPFMTPSVYSEDKTAVATIEQPTCGLALGAENLDFGTLMVGTIAPSDAVAALPVTLQNTGNSITNSLSLTGTDWNDGFVDPDTGLTTTIMPATATHWSISPGDAYASMNAVGPGATVPGTIAAGGQLPVYFRLQADLVPAMENFAGTVSQTLTFVADC